MTMIMELRYLYTNFIESETLAIIWKRVDDCLSNASIVENLRP